MRARRRARTRRRPDPVARSGAASSRVRGRIVAVDPAAEHGDRGPAGLERAAVRLAVDAAGQAADDDQPRTPRAPGRACARPGRRTASTAVRRRRRPPARLSRSASALPRTNSPGGGSWIARSSGGNSGAERAIQRTPALAQASQERSLVEPAREHAETPARAFACTTCEPVSAAKAASVSSLTAPRAPSASGTRAPRDSAPRRPQAPPASAAIVSRHAPDTRPPAPRERQPFDRAVEQRRSPPSSGGTRHVEPLARRRHAIAAPVGRLAAARRPARPPAAAAPRRRGRSGRGARATACPGTRPAAAASTCTRPRDHRARRTGTGSSSPTSWKRAGNTARPPTRAIADDAVLERLPQRLERGPRELGQLVEHEHTAVRQARPRQAAGPGRRRRAPQRRRVWCGARNGGAS